ncbi:MAG: addiction module protein [Proteobacteria bacterium]|nr:addiction module protein [Pseudomonadota bacterium]MBU1738958.1 addiction module protein [Pseudomonadota bacterium]
MSLEEIYAEAQALPSEAKAILAEKLVESIEDDVDPRIARSHLNEVKRRRDEIRTGKVMAINGDEGLAQIRRTMIGE